MTEDQHTQQDPTQQYHQPDQQPEQELEHPGLESEMHPTPDYGEDSYRGSGRLEGRVAIITGGDSGIGRAVALAFAREGADVLISYLAAEEPECSGDGAGRREGRQEGRAGTRRHRGEAQCQRLIEQAISEFGKIDILVNNAAYQMYREGIQSISARELEHTYRTNVFSMFYLCKAALPHMQPGSSIINTSSVEAYQPQPMLLDYASTKAAIVNFTKGLAMEVAQQGIRVNVVAPGPVWTPLIPATMPAEFVSQFGQQESPMGRAAQPAELAPAYVFLASQESSYVNGETLGVTGGTPLP
jgi:NAD(P)-dependent dehydrogenase (short-subunit alcohol dehydrogenase family)